LFNLAIWSKGGIIHAKMQSLTMATNLFVVWKKVNIFYSHSDGASSSRKAAQLIEALKDAENFEQLESNWAVKQNVEETIKFLHQVGTNSGRLVWRYA